MSDNQTDAQQGSIGDDARFLELMNEWADASGFPDEIFDKIAAYIDSRAPAAEPDVIAQRDFYQERADDLAGAIASYLGADIGEHSSGNCPWANAIEALDEADPYDRAPAAQAASVAPEAVGALKANYKGDPNFRSAYLHGFYAAKDAALKLLTAPDPQQEGSEAGK